jgi:hypothetical protein
VPLFTSTGSPGAIFENDLIIGACVLIESSGDVFLSGEQL